MSPGLCSLPASLWEAHSRGVLLLEEAHISPSLSQPRPDLVGKSQINLGFNPCFDHYWFVLTGSQCPYPHSVNNNSTCLVDLLEELNETI